MPTPVDPISIRDVITAASSFVPNLITAVSGLGGVWLGSTLASKREEAREAARSAKDVTYLATLVAAHLDHFINACVEVAGDDGTSYGQPAGEQGEHMATVKTPTFDPLLLNVEWKSLSPDLMYEILNLPYSVAMLNSAISSTAENDFPPDYADTFWERRHGYASLGLEVAKIAARLRKHANLPARVDSWDRIAYLQDIKARFEDMREKSRATNTFPLPLPTNL